MPARAASSFRAWPIRSQIERVVREVPLPLNVIAFPGAPPKAEWASGGRRADQPRPVPAPGADGAADRSGAGGDRLGLARPSLPRPAARRARFEHAAAEDRARRASGSAPTHSTCHASASRWGHSASCSAARAIIAKGEDSGKTAAAIASRARRACRRRGWRSRRSRPAPSSPASTASALRARSKPARRCRGRPRR